MAAAWDDRSAEGQISGQNLRVMNSRRKGLVPGFANGTNWRLTTDDWGLTTGD